MARASSADDEWLRPEELAHCPEKMAEYDAAAPRRCIAPRSGPAARPMVPAPAAAPAPAPLGAPAGFRLAAPAEVLAGAALTGQAVLYRWPDEGWVRGTVARRTRAAGFSHVVRYGRTSAPLGSAEVPSLRDGASHGPVGRWVLLRRVR